MFDDAKPRQAVLAERNSDAIVIKGQTGVTASGAVRLAGSVHPLNDPEVAKKTAWAVPGRAKLENLLEIV